MQAEHNIKYKILKYLFSNSIFIRCRFWYRAKQGRREVLTHGHVFWVLTAAAPYIIMIISNVWIVNKRRGLPGVSYWKGWWWKHSSLRIFSMELESSWLLWWNALQSKMFLRKEILPKAFEKSLSLYIRLHVCESVGSDKCQTFEGFPDLKIFILHLYLRRFLYIHSEL